MVEEAVDELAEVEAEEMKDVGIMDDNSEIMQHVISSHSPTAPGVAIC